jgi:hypothetical protein
MAPAARLALALALLARAGATAAAAAAAVVTPTPAATAAAAAASAAAAVASPPLPPPAPPPPPPSAGGNIDMGVLITGLSTYSLAVQSSIEASFANVASSAIPGTTVFTAADVSVNATSYAAYAAVTLQGACAARRGLGALPTLTGCFGVVCAPPACISHRHFHRPPEQVWHFTPGRSRACPRAS